MGASIVKCKCLKSFPSFVDGKLLYCHCSQVGGGVVCRTEALMCQTYDIVNVLAELSYLGTTGTFVKCKHLKSFCSSFEGNYFIVTINGGGEGRGE